MSFILSQAGGGFMGQGPARYLAEAERVLGGSAIGRRFNLLAGTSVGAIDMALLACGYTAREVLELHQQHGSAIFGTRLWAYRLLKNGPRYDDAAVVRLLKSRLGSLTMAQTIVPLYLTAWDARRRDLKVFGPADHVPVWYAVRCSMAASSYFAPMPGYSMKDGVFQLEGSGRYTDGGMAANDPALVGMAAGFLAGIVSPRDLRVLDLVTSGKTPEGGPLDPSWNILTVLQKVVLPAVTAGNSSDVGFIARAWLHSLQRGGDLFRVCPETPDWGLDETERAPQVEELWAQKWAADWPELARFLQVQPVDPMA